MDGSVRHGVGSVEEALEVFGPVSDGDGIVCEEVLLVGTMWGSVNFVVGPIH